MYCPKHVRFVCYFCIILGCCSIFWQITILSETKIYEQHIDENSNVANIKVFDLSIGCIESTFLGSALEVLGFNYIGWNKTIYDEWSIDFNDSFILKYSENYNAFGQAPWNKINFRKWLKKYGENSRFIILECNNNNNDSDEIINYLHSKNKESQLLTNLRLDDWSTLCNFIGCTQSIPWYPFPHPLSNDIDSNKLKYHLFTPLHDDIYIIHHIINYGLHSIVYHVISLTNHQSYVLKHSKGILNCKSLMNEYKIMMKFKDTIFNKKRNLTHYLVPFVHDFQIVSDDDDGYQCLLKMDLISNGLPLWSFININTKNNVLGFSLIFHCFMDIKHSLSILHENGIFHNDLIPSNILYKYNNNKIQCYLVDFRTMFDFNQHSVEDYYVGNNLYFSCYAFYKLLNMEKRHKCQQNELLEYAIFDDNYNIATLIIDAFIENSINNNHNNRYIKNAYNMLLNLQNISISFGEYKIDKQLNEMIQIWNYRYLMVQQLKKIESLSRTPIFIEIYNIIENDYQFLQSQLYRKFEIGDDEIALFDDNDLYSIQNILGSKQHIHSIIYQVLNKNNNKSYVLKQGLWERDCWALKIEYNLMIKLQNLYNLHNANLNNTQYFAPLAYSFNSNDNENICMLKMDIILNSFELSMIHIDEDIIDRLNTNISLVITTMIDCFNNINNTLALLHKISAYPNDLHGSNILYQYNLNTNKIKCYLIDFGDVFDLNNVNNSNSNDYHKSIYFRKDYNGSPIQFSCYALYILLNEERRNKLNNINELRYYAEMDDYYNAATLILDAFIHIFHRNIDQKTNEIDKELIFLNNNISRDEYESISPSYFQHIWSLRALEVKNIYQIINNQSSNIEIEIIQQFTNILEYIMENHKWSKKYKAQIK